MSNYDVSLQNELDVLKSGTGEDKLIKACNFISNFFKNETT
jgi:hypothetical protein